METKPCEINLSSVRLALFELTDKVPEKHVTARELAEHMKGGKPAWQKTMGEVRPCLLALVQAQIATSRLRTFEKDDPGGRRPVEFRVVPFALSKPLPKEPTLPAWAKHTRPPLRMANPSPLQTAFEKGEPAPNIKARKGLALTKAGSTVRVVAKPSKVEKEAQVARLFLNGTGAIPLRKRQSVASLRKLVTLAELMADFAGFSDNDPAIELTLL